MTRWGWAAFLGMGAWLWVTAAAAAPFDGVYTGTVACQAIGTSAGFTRRIGMVVRDGLFATEHGRSGTDGWERLDGTVDADGLVKITGRYMTGGIEKPIRYEGHVAARQMQAAGPRGPRHCTVTASPPPPGGAGMPYRTAPDAAARRALVGRPAKAPFTCPEAPTPIRDVIAPGFYRKDDPSHSIVDPEAYASLRRAVAPLDALANGVARLGDAYIRTTPRAPPSPPACSAGWTPGPKPTPCWEPSPARGPTSANGR